MASWLGVVYRKWDASADHYKYHIIVGDVSGSLAVIYINTDSRYANLPTQLQGNQLPVTSDNFNFLDHDSFADCSTILEVPKSTVNEYLQREPGHHCGNTPQDTLQQILRVLTYSKVVETITKKKYGFIP